MTELGFTGGAPFSDISFTGDVAAIGVNQMPALAVAVTAVVLCMAVIPLMIRLAPVLGMLDKPNPRKVHGAPVARVGGVGIVAGSLVALLVWLPIDDLLRSYLLGSLVLFGFGAWDDRRELGHYTKFAGQLIAVGLVVLYGDLYITRVPFVYPALVPKGVAIPFTFFAMVGVINAINHSDGLDGLAGGESLLSLMVVALLAYKAQGIETMIIAVAAIGGIVGFLRFNTHPARVFMGDSGSQFIGFTLGFVVILLTQRADTAMSPAAAAFILGLPVIDILSVLYLRISSGRNWFRATRNHVHHRLLDLGLGHGTTVAVIYTIQAAFVLLGIAIRYSSDGRIALLYLTLVVLIFGTITYGERRKRASLSLQGLERFSRALGRIRRHRHLEASLRVIIEWLLPLYFVAISLFASAVPKDLGIGAILLSFVLLLEMFRARGRISLMTRYVVFVLVVFCVYLDALNPPALLHRNPVLDMGFFGTIAVTVGLALRMRTVEEFSATPTDYLSLLIVMTLVLIETPSVLGIPLLPFAVKSLLLFYAAEIAFSLRGRRVTPIEVSTVACLGVIGMRGLI